jgi:hypothetical protein
MDYRLQQFMAKYLPNGKETFSKDAVEILLGLLWEEAVAGEKCDQKEREWEEQHGPRFV